MDRGRGRHDGHRRDRTGGRGPSEARPARASPVDAVSGTGDRTGEQSVTDSERLSECAKNTNTTTTAMPPMRMRRRRRCIPAPCTPRCDATRPGTARNAACSWCPRPRRPGKTTTNMKRPAARRAVPTTPCPPAGRGRSTPAPCIPRSGRPSPARARSAAWGWNSSPAPAPTRGRTPNSSTSPGACGSVPRSPSRCWS